MKTIFAIDNGSDPRAAANFERHLSNLNALGKLAGGPVRLAVGCWKGQLERSYVLDRADFDQHVRNSGYVSAQESFLHTNASKSVFEYQSPSRATVGAPAQRVTAAEALQLDGWTYMLDANEYWAVK